MRITTGANGLIAAAAVVLIPVIVAAGALLNHAVSFDPQATDASLPGVASSHPASPDMFASFTADPPSGGVPASTPVAVAPGTTPASVSPASGAPTGSSPAPPPAWTAAPIPGKTAAPTAAPTAVPTNPPPLPGSQPSFPIRAAFYYPWFPEAWKQSGLNPFTHYTPSLGFYDGSSSATIHAHIAAMQYGGIEVGISSWWGVGTRSDTRLPTILADTAGSSFRWSIYYEGEAYGNPSVAQIASDLSHIRDHYAANASFFKVNGRFVVFVYQDGADGCATASRWAQANAGINAYIVLKVFAGYKTCADQPAGWHQYSPARAADSQPGYSYAIGPGFWLATQGTPVLARDLTRWAQNVRDMVASGAPFQLITTFNEWGEGTSVESATDWASASGYGAYFDLLHTNGQ